MLKTVCGFFRSFAFLMVAVATHLVMSFAQTLMHSSWAPSNGAGCSAYHINFHHTFYSKDHLVSRPYLGDEGTYAFFFIPFPGQRV